MVNIDTQQVIDALNRLSSKVGNLQPVLAEIGEGLILSTKHRFEIGQSPGGIDWADNSEATTQRKIAKGIPLKPLVGETRRLSHEISRTGLDNRSVSIGTSLIYAAVQQFGAAKGEFSSKTPWGDIPARPFLGISDIDTEMIYGTIIEALESSI